MTDRDLVVDLSLRVVMNNFSCREIGRIIRPMFNDAVAKEGYRFLPAQSLHCDEHKGHPHLEKAQFDHNSASQPKK